MSDRLSLSKYLSIEKYARYSYISGLNENMLQECILVTDSPGNNVGNAYFLIAVSNTDSDEVKLEKSLCLLEDIKKQLPQYHTREMRRLLFEKFGRISNQVKPYALRYIYRALTGNCSALTSVVEA